MAFGRFTPRGAEQELEAFVDRDAEEFQKSCPFYEIQDLDLALLSSRKYLVRKHSCPGQRDEIVAVTEVPGFFVTFVLSSNHRNSLESAVPPFKEMLDSFHWVTQPAAAPPPGPKPH